ncbi:MAG: hypothetical protein HW420_83 [Candidatus Nitrosotenuis sp.]|nr:hypothetical protein [Candidatus Nitrosotenuis sp.]
MYEDLVREAIRGQTAESASEVMGQTIPNEVKGFIPDLVSQLDQGVDPSDVADQALNKTFDIVQTVVLSDATNHVVDKFGQRIVDLFFGAPFLNILQQASLLISNSTNLF